MYCFECKQKIGEFDQVHMAQIPKPRRPMHDVFDPTGSAKFDRRPYHANCFPSSAHAQKIRELAQRNAIVSRALMASEDADFTWRETLEHLVVWLAENNQQQHDQIIKLLHGRPLFDLEA